MLSIPLTLRFCGIFSFVFLLFGCVRTILPPIIPATASNAQKSAILHASPCRLSNKTASEADVNNVKNSADLVCKEELSAVDKNKSLPLVKEDDIWLLVDTQKKQLEVKRGEQTLEVFENIALGRGGVGFKQRHGDNVTPLGEYRIGWINSQSQFRTFYGLTYPSAANAKQAYQQHLISLEEYGLILLAHDQAQIPPQDTSLGGQIGIHGLGSRSEIRHHLMDWTYGCIALTNKQLDDLSHWISEGMRVKIK